MIVVGAKKFTERADSITRDLKAPDVATQICQGFGCSIRAVCTQGVLIGRGGETISKIQRESSARIEIHKAKTLLRLWAWSLIFGFAVMQAGFFLSTGCRQDDREALDRQVTITGSADNIEKALSHARAWTNLQSPTPSEIPSFKVPNG